MQVIQPFQFVIGRPYVLSGREVKAVTIKSFGADLDFLRIVYFESVDEKKDRFVTNVWKDGSVYRITPEVPIPKLTLA